MNLLTDINKRQNKLNLNISLSLEGADVEAFVLASADVQKY